MRYVVRLMPNVAERVLNVKIMKSQIPNLEIVTDRYRNGYETFFRMCEMINGTGAVTLEDDAILCENFINIIERKISTSPNDVHSFFEKPKTYFETGYVGGSNFFSLLCVYFPERFPEKLLYYYRQFVNERPQWARGCGTDRLVSYVLIKEKQKYWRHRPTLVQHQSFKSTLGRRSKSRQTIFFIDDLGAKND